MIIRRAAEADVPALLHLIRSLADYEKLGSEVVATETRLRESLFGDRPAAEALLGLVGGESVGMAIYFHNCSTFFARPGLYLEDLFVLPQWRGQGIGRRLLARVARLAVERDCGRMEWSVLDWNESALGFYEQLGARVMEQWRLHRLTGEPLSVCPPFTPSGVELTIQAASRKYRWCSPPRTGDFLIGPIPGGSTDRGTGHSFSSPRCVRLSL